MINLAESSRPEPAEPQIQLAITSILVPRAIAEIAEARTTLQALRQSRIAEGRALAWQTLREGWKVGGLLLPIGLALLTPIYLASSFVNPDWLMLINISVNLVLGASVFGLENQGRTRRFLAIHGAQAWLVCLVKLTIWGVGFAALWGPLALLAGISFAHVGVSAIENWSLGIMMTPLYFSIAVLCGMTIRVQHYGRCRFTGTRISTNDSARVLVTVQMLPVQGLLVLPAGLLVVSLAWSNDWLLDRPGSGPWMSPGIAGHRYGYPGRGLLRGFSRLGYRRRRSYCSTARVT